MKFTVQSSDDTSAPPRTERRQSRSLHCNTPALVGAPANSRTATELGSVAFTGHTNGGALGIVLGGTTPSLFTLATRWGCRRNRARCTIPSRVHYTGAHRGAGGAAHRHRGLYPVAFKWRLPAATRGAAAGTNKTIRLHI